MGKAKDAKGKRSVLGDLKADEGLDVLRRLLTSHPDLVVEAENIARSLLGEVSFETVANEVEDAVGGQDLDDLNGRAGQHEWGYVEPTEAAWEILEEAVEPFVADIKRRIQLGLEADALEICKGVVLGLYRVEHSGGGFVAEWASDFPAEAACDAIETWLAPDRKNKASGRRRKRPPFPQEFVDSEVPDWRDMIARILSRRKTR